MASCENLANFFGEGAIVERVEFNLTTENALLDLANEALARHKAGKSVRVLFIDEEGEEPPKKKRTTTQNAAMHKYFNMLANALNDAGYDMKAVMHEGTDIPWGEWNVKEMLWKTVQKAMFGHESTTELSTDECSKVYDVVNRKIATTTGVSVPWPSKEELMHQSRVRQ